ncbi:hypothetical protein GGI43DRAFT_401930 [Trichoderma evansii]
MPSPLATWYVSWLWGVGCLGGFRGIPPAEICSKETGSVVSRFTTTSRYQLGTKIQWLSLYSTVSICSTCSIAESLYSSHQRFSFTNKGSEVVACKSQWWLCAI